MRHYYTSDGERIPKSVVDRRVREAKKKKLDQFFNKHGYYFCEDCQNNECIPVDCSHDKSVKWCQENGKTEMAWDVDNITLRGRACHRKWDKSY